MRTDDELQFGRAKAKVLSPTSLAGDPNSDSVVIDVTAGGKQFLFTGDVTGAHETDVGTICARGPPIYLLKVAHHGSKYSTTAAFLSQAKPRFAVICVGKNSYGHPAPATINRLKAHKTRIYSTQKNGNVTLVVTSAGTVTWTFSRSSKPVTSAGSPSTPQAGAERHDRLHHQHRRVLSPRRLSLPLALLHPDQPGRRQGPGLPAVQRLQAADVRTRGRGYDKAHLAGPRYRSRRARRAGSRRVGGVGTCGKRPAQAEGW